MGNSESPQKESLPTYTLRSPLKGGNVFGTLDDNDVIYIVEIPYAKQLIYQAFLKDF